MSKAISCWPSCGKRLSASRSAACRSAASSSWSAAPACWPGRLPASRAWTGMCGPCAVCRTRPHSRLVVAASHPGSAAGSRILSSWPARRSQTLWPTSFGVGAAEPIPAAYRPDQRGIPLRERAPCLLVAGARAGHQVGNQRAIARRVSGRPAGELCAAMIIHSLPRPHGAALRRRSGLPRASTARKSAEECLGEHDAA